MDSTQVQASAVSALVVRKRGLQPYEQAWKEMQNFTADRDSSFADEFWTLEHPKVFTLGLSKQPSFFALNDDIPVIKSDRGGKVTYHGPGQIVGYFLWDLRRLGMDVHQFVTIVEQCMINTLSAFDIHADRWQGNPGIYVEGRKIGSLGIRLKHGCSYHGLALNVDMDLTPFGWIDPCGIEGLQVTQIRDYSDSIEKTDVEEVLIEKTRELYDLQLN